MPAPKGHPKSGGRKKGTPNKCDEKTKKKLSAIAYDNIEKVQRTLEEMEGKDYMWAMLKLFDKIVPNPVAIKMEGEMKSETTISQRDAEILKSIPSDVIASIAGQLQASMSTILSANDGPDPESDVDDENEEAE